MRSILLHYFHMGKIRGTHEAELTYTLRKCMLSGKANKALLQSTEGFRRMAGQKVCSPKVLCAVTLRWTFQRLP